MKLFDILNHAFSIGASDVHITVGLAPVIRINGDLHKLNTDRLLPEHTEAFAKEILTYEQIQRFEDIGEIDLSLSFKGLGRLRVNVYRQRGSYSMAIRTVAGAVPDIDALGLPPILKALAQKRRGLILITGPTGSGKSTTLASMINHMNNTRKEHIITIEDPIEFLHKHNTCMINQREIGPDTKSFANALRASLREDPDVILVGEMRDLETIQTALTAAETGHLVLSTLHTIGATKTIDRIIDVFPPHQQQQVRVQLAFVLEGIVSQQLLPRKDGAGRVGAHEIMLSTPSVRNLIREGKSYQLNSIIQTSGQFGMETMDGALKNLYKNGMIDLETFKKYAVDFDTTFNK